MRQNIWNNFCDIAMFLISLKDIIKESEKHLFGAGSNLSNILHLDKLLYGIIT